MKGFIYDSIMVLAIFVGIVFGLCGRYLDRRCDHCKEITYYIDHRGQQGRSVRGENAQSRSSSFFYSKQFFQKSKSLRKAL